MEFLQIFTWPVVAGATAVSVAVIAIVLLAIRKID